MILISHRGNLLGPNKETENNPKRILECIKFGFTVEVDLRINENGLMLGHDSPTYLIGESFLSDNRNSLVIHAKDIHTASKLLATDHKYNWFFHDLDRMTLTSWKWMWLYPGEYSKDGVILNFNDPSISGFETRECFGICTDYPTKYMRGKL